MKRVFAALLFVALAVANASAATFDIRPLSAGMIQKMRGLSWHEGCPVGFDELRELNVTYRDFAAREKTGVLIVNKAVAGELEKILRDLFEHGFQIEHLAPVEEYGGSDDASMAANNTSAFNCRDTTGRPGVFSNHSWGRAIDINPLTNPYVKGDLVLPPGGRAYLDRTKVIPRIDSAPTAISSGASKAPAGRGADAGQTARITSTSKNRCALGARL